MAAYHIDKKALEFYAEICDHYLDVANIKMHGTIPLTSDASQCHQKIL